MEETNSNYKLLLVGDSAVGKTSLIKVYKNQEISTYLPPTLGCEYHIINQNVNNKDIKLLIWDTAGQERFRSISKSWYRNSRGVLIVFSVIDRKSFDNIRRWMDDLVNEISNFSLIIVGNKSDLKEKRVVTYEEGVEIAKEFKVPYYETSIFEDKMLEGSVKISEIFKELTKDILEKDKGRKGSEEEVGEQFQIGEGNVKEVKKGCRC